MRTIDADALQLAIVEEGQANKRKKYIIGDIWELTGAEIREVINSQPTIQPEPHWIPVTERLPENGRQVLVYARSVHYALAKYDEMRNADGTYKKQWVTFDAWKPFYSIKEVIAWCELPEPFEGVTE